MHGPNNGVFTVQPVYVEIRIEYFGYTLQIPLEFGHPFSIDSYGAGYERITRYSHCNNCVVDKYKFSYKPAQ